MKITLRNSVYVAFLAVTLSAATVSCKDNRNETEDTEMNDTLAPMDNSMDNTTMDNEIENDTTDMMMENDSVM